MDLRTDGRAGRGGADDGGRRPALGGAMQGAPEGGGQIGGSAAAVRRSEGVAGRQAKAKAWVQHWRASGGLGAAPRRQVLMSRDSSEER